ncbi:MAG: HAD hydrolase-like protein [Minisyncoccales bacterium]
MEIGLDFDGVIIDREKLLMQAAEYLYRIKLSPKILKREILIESGILTKEQYNQLGRQIFETEEWGLRMKPVQGVLEYLSKLQIDRHKIKIITSRGDIASDIAREWLKQKGIENIPVISVGYKNSKIEACQGLDIYIDDDLDKVESLVGVVPFLFLFSWPYNERSPINSSIIQRVYSWKHFYSEIEKRRK